MGRFWPAGFVDRELVCSSTRGRLNTPQWKKELCVPSEMTAIAPMIVGLPAVETPPVSRKPPEIHCWK